MAQDPFKYFRIEAAELIGELAKGVAELGRGGDVARMLRAAHTLKGAARIVRHASIAEASHALEGVLGALRDAPGPSPAAAALVDRMSADLALIVDPAANPQPSNRAADETVRAADVAVRPADGRREPPATPPSTTNATRIASAASAASAANPATPRPARPVEATVRVPDDTVRAADERVRAADDAIVAAAPRIDTSALDEALAGLQAVHALVGRARAARDAVAVARYLEQADRELREVRRDVEHLRLASFGSLYAALERTARDAAASTGKRVRFSLEGSDVRVDGAVLHALHGALVQLVRNAVAHGLEPADQRARAGKPADGRVTVSARALGGRIAVVCEDDGRGLDIEAIARAARARGLTVDRELDATAAFQLTMRNGLSTSREVTELSGRGIGLDVVRDAVSTLGGEVAVTSSRAGTAITLRVPVSATAVPMLDVLANGRTIAIPRGAVRRVGRVVAEQLVHAGETTQLRVGDRAVPCVPLASVLGDPAPHGATLVVIDGGDGMAAVTVDRALGIADQVVRALPAGAPIDPIVWGMVLGDEGQPYPVIEPRALVAAATAGRARVAAPEPPRVKLPVLVVDDSLTTRMLEQSILESAGYEVHLAASAEEALDRLLARPYALMLADVEMPGMDGFTLIAELRARPALASLPAVLVTSRDSDADRRRGAQVGAHGYIVKSQFDQNEVLALIARLIR